MLSINIIIHQQHTAGRVSNLSQSTRKVYNGAS